MIKKTDKIQAPPLFSKGCLTFKDSKHTLVKDGEYYRCSEKTKGFCIKKSEKLINAKNLERRLGRLREKFLLPEGTGLILFEKIMPIIMQKLMKGGNNEDHLQNNLEATGNLIIADLKDGKKINRNDFAEFKRVLFEILKEFYSSMLVGFLLNFLLVLIESESDQSEMQSYFKKFFPQKPQKLNHAFALNLKKVYLSEEGEIENIEMEGFSWFAFNYFRKNIPEYIPKVKEGFILNKKEFKTLDCFEVMEEFIKNDLIDTFSYNAFATKHSKKKLLDKIFGGFDKLSNDEKIDYLKKLNSITPEAINAMFSTILRN